MKKIRTCVSGKLNTGGSKCPVEFGKIKAIILVERGKTLGEAISATSLQTLCHEDRPARIYPIKTVVEYAKNGGEPQVSAVGYGGNGVTGISARTDTFTLDKYYEGIAASITKNMNKKFDAYYIDSNNLLIGVNNGTDELGGFPLTTIYTTVVPHPTSGAKASMTVSLAYEDAQAAIEDLDYIQLDSNPVDSIEGLTMVDLVGTASNKFKILETVGGYDRTAEFGSLIATNATNVLLGATTASYDEDEDVITITAQSGVTPGLKSPKTLFAMNITGIEYNKTIPYSA